MRLDDRIPVLLIQRTLEAPGRKSQAIHGYTLVLPVGWSMAFWSSLTYTGTRVGGQRERQTQAFEAGILYFPRDFVFSKAYEGWAEEKEREEREKWAKKPPAKRVNFTKLGVRSPWKADWDVVLGLREPSNFTAPGKGAKGEEEDSIQKYSSTQRDNVLTPDIGNSQEGGQDADVDIHETSEDMDIDESELKPWLIRGSEISRIVGVLQRDPAANLLIEANNLRQKRLLGALNPTIGADDLLKYALVNVKVTMFKEGVPEDMAMIYRVSDEEAMTWEQLMTGNETSETGVNVLQVRCT